MLLLVEAFRKRAQFIGLGVGVGVGVGIERSKNRSRSRSYDGCWYRGYKFTWALLS